MATSATAKAKGGERGSLRTMWPATTPNNGVRKVNEDSLEAE
jgi:hypothetical protein